MLAVRYIKETLRFKRFMLEALILMIFISGIQLVFPQYIRTMLDDYIPNMRVREAVFYFFIIIGVFFARSIMIVRRNRQMLNFGFRFIYQLRMRLMRHLQLLSSRYYDKTPMGDILIRITDDINHVEALTTDALIYLVTDSIIIVGVSVILFLTDVRLALAVLAIMPVYILNFIFFKNKLSQKHRVIQRNYSDFSSAVSESIAGFKIIKSFTLEKFKNRKLEQFIGRDADMRIDVHTNEAVFKVIGEFLTIIGTALVLLYGGYLVMQGEISVGQVVAFYTYVSYLYSPLLQFTGTIQIVQRGLVSMERIYELLDTRPWPAEKSGAIDPRPIKGSVEFKNVTFYYEKSKLPNLRNINFKVVPDSCTALVGESGGGKSTILNLILRFYDPTEGQVLIDDKDTRDVKINPLRNSISVILQEGFLFSGTVYDNIRMGRLEASDSEIEESAQNAQAWKLISSLPQGMQTKLGEGGIQLSGGQKQLIALARATLRNAPIVLLDEPTSAMDAETESLVQKSLTNLLKGRAAIIIAHRLSTIRMADEILVVRRGEIIQHGSNKELLKQGGYYKRLNDLQFGINDA
ncbi:MAG: ABC transporter ATP-binding protein [bacterium]